MRVLVPRRRLPIGLVASSLIAETALAGCAAPAATPPAGAAAGSQAAGAVHPGGATPPEAALMICSAQVRARVAGALNLDRTTSPRPAWADPVYTCTYPLPMGPLVLSVTVAPSGAAAREMLAGMRRQLGATHDEPGLGERAYGTATGTVVAVKDNMVLRVDATALPEDLGVTHERRIDLAEVVAAGVFDCWTGGG